MPKRTETPCDGCSAVRDDLKRVGDLALCPGCQRRREVDPPITYRGQTLLWSEFQRQAKHDPDLKAAMAGDTVQDQIKAAKQ